MALLIGVLGWSYASDGIVRSLCNPRNTAELIQSDILATKGAALIDVLLIVGIVFAVLLADRVGRTSALMAPGRSMHKGDAYFWRTGRTSLYLREVGIAKAHHVPIKIMAFGISKCSIHNMSHANIACYKAANTRRRNKS